MKCPEQAAYSGGFLGNIKELARLSCSLALFVIFTADFVAVRGRTQKYEKTTLSIDEIKDI